MATRMEEEWEAAVQGRERELFGIAVIFMGFDVSWTFTISKGSLKVFWEQLKDRQMHIYLGWSGLAI